MDFYAGPGRIVLYNTAPPGGVPDYRPAIIVRVLGDPADPACPVNLHVFLDGSNDCGLYGGQTIVPDALAWITERQHGRVGEDCKWIWPQELAG